MEIAQLLSEDDISLDVSVKGKRSALAGIATHIATRHGPPGSTVLAALLGRERLGSTGVGHGTAIPHAFVEGLAAPAASLTRLSQPIDFDAPDEAPVDLVFTLLWPRRDRSGFLPALNGVCRPFRSPTFRKQLRQAQSGQEALAAIRQAAQCMPAVDLPGTAVSGRRNAYVLPQELSLLATPDRVGFNVGRRFRQSREAF